MVKERVLWVDVARGIGILLVILGHTLSGAQEKVFIYAFHVPLFFFLSGLFFKPEPVLDQIKKSTKNLLVPYLLFAFLTYGFTRLSAPAADVTLTHLWYQTQRILYANGTNDGLGFNVVLWFLPCLFMIRILFTWIYNLTSGSIGKIGLVLSISSLFGYSIATNLGWLKLPFMGEVVPTGIVFYGLGYLFWRYKEKLVGLIKTYMLTTILLGLFVYINCAWFNFLWSGRTIDMFYLHLNNYWLFYGGAITGILICLCISMLLEKLTWLSYIGQKSLVLLVWHLVLFVYINMLFHTVIPTDIYMLLGTWGRGLTATALVTSFILFVNWVWEENIKFLLEKS